MADLRELPLSIRIFLRAYRWRTIVNTPWTRLAKPLSACRIALVSTAGLVLPGQPPFDDSIKGGDWSFREVPGDADVASMIDTHRSESFDHSGLAADRNLGFPIERLRELRDRGAIGEINRRHFSLMGSITAPGRLLKESVPSVVQALVEDGVDATLLVPI